MKDQFQRIIDYARISITDRCNLHCTYCRPDHAEKLSHEEILRYEEILRLCKILTTLGIDKFKITGGEPFVRKGCADFIHELKEMDGVSKVTVTTNAILLSRDLTKLAEAGIDGINVSLDFMDREKYRRITGYDGYEQVMTAIKEAVSMGLNIKINAVLTDQTTMEDIQKFIDYIKYHKICIRFIEQMPLDNRQITSSSISRDEIRNNLKDQGMKFHKVKQRMGNGPAVYETIEGYQGMIGWIEALHGKFCDTCNRIRLTSTGGIKPCLYYEEADNIRDFLRNGSSDETIRQMLEEMIYKKPQAHHFEEKPADSKMYTIGG